MRSLECKSTVCAVVFARGVNYCKSSKVNKPNCGVRRKKRENRHHFILPTTTTASQPAIQHHLHHTTRPGGTLWMSLETTQVRRFRKCV